MRRELENYELIDRYLEGSLSEADTDDFERQMQNDPELRADVNTMREVNLLILDQGLLEIKSKLKALDKKPDVLSNGRKYFYSAVLIGMVAAVTTGYFVSRPVDVNPSPIHEVKPPSDVSPLTKRPTPAAKENHQTIPKSTTNAAPTIPPDSLILTIAPRNILFPQQDTISRIKATESPIALPELKEIDSEAKKPCVIEDSKLIVTVAETCDSEASGIITIDNRSLLEGTPPFEFSINGNSFFDGRSFGNLEAGTYYLSVKDANGCTWLNAKEIHVASKDCREHEMSFYPSRGETFKFPIENNDNGKIVIYNNEGSIVYQATITNGYPDRWDGTDNGHALPLGSYSYVLSVNGKNSTGFVTLFN